MSFTEHSGLIQPKFKTPLDYEVDEVGMLSPPYSPSLKNLKSYIFRGSAPSP